MTLVFVESTVRLRQLTSCLGVYPGVQFCTRCTVLLRRMGKGKKRKKGRRKLKGRILCSGHFSLGQERMVWLGGSVPPCRLRRR